MKNLTIREARQSLQIKRPEKFFFQIMNFLDAKAWFAENLRVCLSTEMVF